jgi:TPR repeat protein
MSVELYLSGFRVDSRTPAPATRVLAVCVCIAALVFSPDIVRAGASEDCAAANNRHDYTEALRLCRPLAEQGEAKAQTALGVIYEQGQGVTQDSTQAASWFRKAAEQGEPVAQTALGVMYESGIGVPPDNVLACMWLNLAAAQRDGDAAKLRDSLARFMTPDQIAEAQRMAREWKPTK